MLNLVGIGLCDEKDITLRGLEAVRRSSVVYLEVSEFDITKPECKLSFTNMKGFYSVLRLDKTNLGRKL